MPSPRWWIKLWIEILDDPKMGMMPDHIWRRTVEMFLRAGELNEDGNLHTVDELTWRLRGDDVEMIQALRYMETAGIVEHMPDGGWRLMHFAKRNEALDDVTRQRLSRKAKQNSNAMGHMTVTKSDQKREEESDSESDSEKDSLSLSEPVQEFLKLAGMKKFPKGSEVHLAALAELIRENGPEKTLACARWVWQKADMTLARAISSMQTAVPGWTIDQIPPKNNGNGHKPAPSGSSGNPFADEIARRKAEALANGR